MPPARPDVASSQAERSPEGLSPARERRWQSRCELVLGACLAASFLLPGELGAQAASAMGWTPFASLLLALLVAALAVLGHSVARPPAVRRSSARWARNSGYVMLVAGVIAIVGVASASLGWLPVGLYSPRDGTSTVDVGGCPQYDGAATPESSPPVFPPGARVTVQWSSSNGTNVTFIAGQLVVGVVGSPTIIQSGSRGEFVETGSGGHSIFVAFAPVPPDNCSSLGTVSVSWAYQVW